MNLVPRSASGDVKTGSAKVPLQERKESCASGSGAINQSMQENGDNDIKQLMSRHWL